MADFEIPYYEARRTADKYAADLRAHELADLKAKEEAERKPPPPDRLGPAKSLYEAMIEDAEWVGACRVSAWLERSINRTKPGTNGWPPHVTMEEYCRKELGMNADGTAMLAGPTTEEPEPRGRDRRCIPRDGVTVNSIGRHRVR